MRPAVLMLVLVTSSCETLTESPQRQPLAAILRGDAVRPVAVGSAGAGTLTATLLGGGDGAEMEYAIEFSGLTGSVTALHLHGPAGPDVVADVLVDFANLPAGSDGTIDWNGTFGRATGRLDLRSAITATVSGDSLHRLLDAGLVYVDLHSDSASAGEIRGQVLKR